MSDIINLRSPNLETCMGEKVLQQCVVFWDQTLPWIDGSDFLNFWCDILICCHWTISPVFFQDLGHLKSKYLTELRVSAKIGLKIITRFNICKNLSSAQISIKSGELNLKLCYYANKQQLTKLSLVYLLSWVIFAGLIWVVWLS